MFLKMIANEKEETFPEASEQDQEALASSNDEEETSEQEEDPTTEEPEESPSENDATSEEEENSSNTNEEPVEEDSEEKLADKESVVLIFKSFRSKLKSVSHYLKILEDQLTIAKTEDERNKIYKAQKVIYSLKTQIETILYLDFDVTNLEKLEKLSKLIDKKFEITINVIDKINEENSK